MTGVDGFRAQRVSLSEFCGGADGWPEISPREPVPDREDGYGPKRRSHLMAGAKLADAADAADRASERAKRMNAALKDAYPRFGAAAVNQVLLGSAIDAIEEAGRLREAARGSVRPDPVLPFQVKPTSYGHVPWRPAEAPKPTRARGEAPPTRAVIGALARQVADAGYLDQSVSFQLYLERSPWLAGWQDLSFPRNALMEGLDAGRAVGKWWKKLGLLRPEGEVVARGNALEVRSAQGRPREELEELCPTFEPEAAFRQHLERLGLGPWDAVARTALPSEEEPLAESRLRHAFLVGYCAGFESWALAGPDRPRR